jgi:CMP-N-acetylneuraminic acid synthetase
VTTIAALVPMRHHSQRVPGKNYRMLAGKPLYYHIIEALLAVPEIKSITVDTDSDIIVDGLQAQFPQVKILERAEHLRGDTISMNEILIHDTGHVQADFYLQTHTTNPLLKAATISQAIREFLGRYPKCDSLFSVTRWQTRLYDESGRALNHDPAVLLQTQDLPPVYEENSCLYLFSRSNLLANGHRIGKTPLLFEIPPEEAWDIDDLLDFEICDFLLSRRSAGDAAVS